MLYNRERNWLRGSRGSSLQEAMAGSICAIFIEIVAFIGATWYKTPSMGYSRCPKRPIMNNSTSAPVIWDGQLLPTNMSFLPRKLVTGLTGIPGPWLCLLLWAQNWLFTGLFPCSPPFLGRHNIPERVTRSKWSQASAAVYSRWLSCEEPKGLGQGKLSMTTTWHCQLSSALRCMGPRSPYDYIIQ